MSDQRGRPSLPPAALANDMMVYYAPEILYTEEVTMMEMVCASVCLTSMICFSFEKKYRGERVFDEKVYMNNHRMGARGNATSFPSPWQDLILQLRASDEHGRAGSDMQLPRSGEELSNFVSVLLKTSDEGDTQDSLAKFVHQAIVRREVVIRLIKEMKRCGHRAYRNVDIKKVEEKARATLPENGVPAAIAKLIPFDSHLDNIQVQKQATPVSARSSLEQVKETFKFQKPNAVVLEKSSQDESDINTQRIAALRHFASKLDVVVEDEPEPDGTESENSEGMERNDAKTRKRKITGAGKYCSVRDAHKILNEQKHDRKVQRFACATGNAMIDQFEPWYFGVAFAFVFKYCTGMPDMPAFAKLPHYRRPPDAPRIEPALWVRVMARRVEAQLSRDWSFGFATFNYLFRSAVNLSRTIYAYERVEATDNEPRGLTPELLEKGAIEIMRALQGSYKDTNGRMQKVNGDMTKVRFVVNLSRAAQRLLQNIEHTSRRMAGTQETRRLMRFDTNAHRVKYGVPIFVTFSPDEGHNLLFVRLSRTRRQDPVFAKGKDAMGKRFCDQDSPGIASDLSSFTVAVEAKAILDSLPAHDVRKRILARDSLASADGFHTLVLAAYEYLFGMRVCIFCPDCNNGDRSMPCQDLFGSNALAEGGIFGRVDAGYTSIEAQKSTGSLHAHSQLFVQCLHQHTPLAEILEIMRGRQGDLVKDYLVYKGHVCRQIYAATDDTMKDRLVALEKEWPEYTTATEMIMRPEYLSRRDGLDGAARTWVVAQAKQWAARYLSKAEADVSTAEAWAAEYMGKDVQTLQEHKQHHVHVYNEETQQRCKIYLLLIAYGGPRNVARNVLSRMLRAFTTHVILPQLLYGSSRCKIGTTQSSHPLTLIARSYIGSHSLLPSTTSCRAPQVVRSVTLLLVKLIYRLSAESSQKI